MCDSLPYLPRQWNRVENRCGINIIYDSIHKGNILQYKKNSSNLTNKQRYSKIAKGQWINRNRTWATQNSRGYTNPNNLNLQRNGSINIQTNAVIPSNISCHNIIPSLTNNVLPPTNIVSANNETILPEIINGIEINVNLGNEFPLFTVPEEESILIPDLGTLNCSVQENICNGEIISKTRINSCFPTTDSNVPGSIELLCWNEGIQTWYPRQRYKMTNSDIKPSSILIQ